MSVARLTLSRFIGSFSKSIGLGSSRTLIIISGLQAVLCFFYFFKLASFFKITVYVFVDRVTYIDPFDYYLYSNYYNEIIILVITLVWLFLSVKPLKIRFLLLASYGAAVVTTVLANLSSIFDIIVLMSVPLLLTYSICEKKILGLFPSNDLRKNYRMTSVRLTLFYITLISLILGITSIVITSARILFGISFPLNFDYGYGVSLIISSVSPILMILLSFSIPVKILLNELTAGVARIYDRKFKLSPFPDDSLSHPIPKLTEVTVKKNEGRISSRTRIAFLSLFIALSIIIAIIPHQLTINRDNQQIGSDSESYIGWLEILVTQSTNAEAFLKTIFINILGGDRPLTLLFLSILVKIINIPPFYVVEYLPVILGPSLVLTIYFFTRELTSNETTALLAAFITASASFHLLIGIYAGFYANWLALIFGYLTITFLFRYLSQDKKKNFLFFSILIIVLLFTHVYTWTVLAAVMGVFLVIGWSFNYYPRRRIVLLLLLILSSVAVDVIKSTLTGSSGGIEGDMQVAESSVGIEQLASRWYNLVDTIQRHFGSVFSNFVILVLGLFWLVRSNLRRVPSDMFLALFLSAAILPIFLGDWIVQSRVLYNIPFQIPAAIAMTCILNQKSYRIRMIIIPICIWLIAISIRTASNFYEVLPS